MLLDSTADELDTSHTFPAISESTLVFCNYIGIAMVILPYFGPMGKLKFQFSLSIRRNLTHKRGVILVILIFTELPCSSSSSG